MKNLKSANDKIQEICDVLKKESLEPAQKEAKSIIESAEREAKRIRQEAEAAADTRFQQALEEIEQQNNVFQSSLAQASKQALEALRQSIVAKLFNQELVQIVEKGSSNPDVVAQLIKAIVDALEKDGLGADLSVYVPAHVSPKDINHALGKSVLDRLKSQTVEVGDFKGGAKVKIEEKRLTIDISDKALMELFASYLKKPEFRNLIFNAG